LLAVWVFLQWLFQWCGVLAVALGVSIRSLQCVALLLKRCHPLVDVIVKLVSLKYGENWVWYLARQRVIIPPLLGGIMAAGVCVVSIYPPAFEPRSWAFIGV
jgi:hypothetical protein